MRGFWGIGVTGWFLDYLSCSPLFFDEIALVVFTQPT